MGGAAQEALPSAAVLRQLLDYDTETGVLTWRTRPRSMFRDTAGRSAEHACSLWNSKLAGKPAGSDSGNGYIKVRLPSGMIAAHRVIWALVTGEWPTGEIDHINQNRADNRWTNLRDVSRLENARNHALQRNNSTGFAGISRRGEGWRVRISNRGSRIHLGDFESLMDAVSARREAEERLGYSANHGRTASCW